MNKIVCDVCGTSYPETATQCPICGIAKTDASKSATGGDSGYVFVKGGRFSHANVRKRNAGKKELPRVVAPVKPQKESVAKTSQETAPAVPKKEQPVRRQTTAARQKPDREKRERRTNLVLALIALLLVLAIVAVFAWLVRGWLVGNESTEPAGSSSQSTSSSSAEIACTDVRLALGEKIFTSMEDKFYLSVTVTPADTTDTVWYESSDERIATVDDKGIVYPVADGQAIIYVHCGAYTAECHITCEVGREPVDPTQPSDPTAPTEPAVVLKLNREEFSLNGYGDSHILYNGELDPAEITWTSSDETVATVNNGKVVAVGNGTATITAEYMGQKATCVVRCANVVVSNYELRTRFGLGSDFTIKVGDTITLFMIEKESGLRIQAADLIFALNKEGIITIDETGKITAIKSGTVTVTVIYGEVTLKSTVRVTKK